MGDPKKAAIELLRLQQMISLAHQDDIDYVEALPEVPADVPSVQFFTDVRRKVGAAQGIDYSHIPDEDTIISPMSARKPASRQGGRRHGIASFPG